VSKFDNKDYEKDGYTVCGTGVWAIFPKLVLNKYKVDISKMFHRIRNGTIAIQEKISNTTVKKPGIRFFAPWVSEVTIYSTQVSRANVTVEEIYTSDKIAIRVSFDVSYKIKEDREKIFHSRAKEPEMQLIKKIASFIREEYSKCNHEQAIHTTTENIFRDDPKTLKKQLLRDAEELALRITDIKLNNIALPEKMESAIEEEKISEHLANAKANINKAVLDLYEQALIKTGSKEEALNIVEKQYGIDTATALAGGGLKSLVNINP